MGFFDHLIAHAAVKAFSDASKETKKHNDLCYELSDLEAEFDAYLKRIGCNAIYMADWGVIDTGSTYPERKRIEAYKQKLETYRKMGGDLSLIDDLYDIDDWIEKVKYLRDKGCLHRQEEFRNENDLYWIKDVIEKEESENKKLSVLFNTTGNKIHSTITKDHPLFVPYDDIYTESINIETARIYDEDIVQFFDFMHVSAKFTNDGAYVYYFYDQSKMYYLMEFDSDEKVIVAATSIPAIPSWGLVNINELQLLMSMEDAKRLEEFYDLRNNAIIESSTFTYDLDDDLADETEYEMPIFESFSVFDALIWDAKHGRFLDYDVEIKFSTKKIIVYLTGLEKELFSVDIQEGASVRTELIETEIPDKTILKLAKSTQILMDTSDAKKVKEYYDKYLDAIEDMEEEKQKRITEIYNSIPSLDDMTLISIKAIDEHILLNHDTVICLQLLLAHKKYRNVELLDEEATEDTNTLLGIASVRRLIDTICDVIKNDYPHYTEEELQFACWESFKQVSVTYYSQKWEEIYGLYLDEPLAQNSSSEADGTLDRYIEKVLLCDDISNSDVWVYCYFTYYMMDKGYTVGDLYYPAYFELVATAFLQFKENMGLN